MQAQQIVEQAHIAATEASIQEVVQQASVLASMLGLEKEFVIAEAAFNIPKQMALGFADLAKFNYRGATQHFLSAATWGVAAGTAIASMIGGGGGSYGGGYGGGGGSVAGPSVVSPGSLTPSQQAALLAPGASGALARSGAAPQPVVIHLEQHFQAVYGGRAGLTDLTNHVIEGINHAVLVQDRKVMSSHVVNPPPVSRGRQ
jgi:hypothetical protein